MSSEDRTPTLASRILGLFEKRIDGDDALLELARTKFGRAGLGTEIYAESPEHLEHMLTFRPPGETLATVHLPRGLNLLDEGSRRLVLHFARRFRERIYGLTVHDQEEIRTRFEDYRSALELLQAELEAIRGGPFLFVEYAAGLEPDLFIRLFRKAAGFGRISASVDTGHMGLREVRRIYSVAHPGEKIPMLTSSSTRAQERIEDIQNAVRSAPAMVRQAILELAAIGKPLHFHLHDGHPLIQAGYGVSDHLSFFAEVPIPFEYEGRRILPTLYGPGGLRGLVMGSLSVLDLDCVSYSLEIHPNGGRMPLGEDESLFRHWKDLENAEQMNHWLSMIIQNQRLLLKLVGNPGPPPLSMGKMGKMDTHEEK